MLRVEGLEIRVDGWRLRAEGVWFRVQDFRLNPWFSARTHGPTPRQQIGGVDGSGFLAKSLGLGIEVLEIRIDC